MARKFDSNAATGGRSKAGKSRGVKTIGDAVSAGLRPGKSQGGRPSQVYAPPSGNQGGSLRRSPTGNGTRGGGGSGGGGGGMSASERAARNAASAAAAAESKAKTAGKDQTAKENANTQKIIDALLGGLKGFEAGRDTQLKNAATTLEAALRGITSNYANAVADYDKTGDANEQDEASKTAANIANRARERMSLLEQAASQGAGETDQLRAQLQAFQNFDNNANEITRSFYDTQRSLNSQINNANSQAESSRRSAWQQNQESVISAESEYNKNISDTWTNIQRTAAQNTNIDSDYSEGFTADFKGKDPVKEASRLIGRVPTAKEKDEKWYSDFKGRRGERDRTTSATNRAASTTIKAPKAAEGATLRGKW